MWKGTRTTGKTLDEGDPVGASPISISQTPNSIFVGPGAFESRRKKSFRRLHPVSLKTTTQAGETTPFAAHNHPHLQQPHPPMPYLRNYNGAIGQTHRRQPRSLFLSLWVWVGSQMAAIATSESSAPQERTLPLALGHTSWRRIAYCEWWSWLPSFVRIPCSSVRRHHDRFPI